MEEQKIAYCGLDCARCPILIATARDDSILRHNVFREWSALLSEHPEDPEIRDIGPEDMRCRGCRPERDRFRGCTTCGIRKCCREKNLDSCAYCGEYNECGMLNGFHSVPENKPAKDNLEVIRSGM